MISTSVPGYFFQQIAVKVRARDFGLTKILWVVLLFWFIYTTAMDKIQVEEMHDIFSQKITYELPQNLLFWVIEYTIFVKLFKHY